MRLIKSIPSHLSTENVPLEDRQRYLDKRLRKLVAYAYTKAPTIKARFDKAGISPSAVYTIKDLEKLPVLRKDELVELHKTSPPFGGLVTVPIERLNRVYVSPGPIYDPYHIDTAFWRRHTQAARALGFGKGDIIVNTWSYHLVPAGLLIDEMLRRVGAVVIPTGVGNTELQVQTMHYLKATGFFGSSSFFMTIIHKAEEMGYDIRQDFKLRLVCIGGEMGGGPIRTLVEKRYRIATRDMYATAEFGVIAYECENKSGMHLAEEIIVEMINPQTGKPASSGEVGEVVVTPLDKTYPLIRFGTGDLAGIIDEPCPCGRTSPRITHILGRVGEAVRVRGMFVHPRQFEPALFKFLQVSKCQAVVTRLGYRDQLTLKVELQSGDRVDREKLKTELSQAVKEAIRIKVDEVEFVAKGVIPEGCKRIVDERVY